MHDNIKAIFTGLESLTGKGIVEKGSKLNLPVGYVNTSDGLYRLKGKDAEQITYSPIIPLERGIGADKQSYPQVRFMTLNAYGAHVIVTVDMDANGLSNISSMFGNYGIGVLSGQSKQLETFAMRCQHSSMPMYLVAEGNGPVSGQFAFIHGKKAFYSKLVDGFDRVDLKSAEQLPASIHSRGTFKDWHAGIEKHAHGSPQIFALSASIASYFMPLDKEESAAFHFYGGSTTGKTLLLQLAASLHGAGGEPGDASGSMIGRWNTTVNGLEAHLSNYSGTALLLDELGSFKGRDLDGALYNITAGQSKTRMTRRLGLQKIMTWTGYILSSGELSISDKLSEQGRTLTEGLQHRALSIELKPEDAGSEGESVDSIRARAEALKELVTEHYGVAIHALLEFLVDTKDDDGYDLTYEVLVDYVSDDVQNFEESLAKDLEDAGIKLTSVQNRALHRLANVAAWGALASKDGLFEVLPFTTEQIYQSVFDIAMRWVKDDQNKYSPEKLAIYEMYGQLQTKHHMNFAEAGEDWEPKQFWGYSRDDQFFILDSVFEGWCKKHNIASFKVAKALETAGYLSTEGKGHYKKRLKFNGKQLNVFQLSTLFLEADIDREF